MASAAPAYRQSARKSARNRNVRVVRGTRQEAGLSHSVVVAARVLVLAVVFFAVIGCARIGLTAATVNTAIATETLTSQISDLQSAGAGLEVKESSLTNPSYIRSIATHELGMSAPTSVDTIALGGDVVACDAEGNLSLSLSLAQVAQG